VSATPSDLAASGVYGLGRMARSEDEQLAGLSLLAKTGGACG
jgi:hypothetical protein